MIYIGIPDARTGSLVAGFMLWASLIIVRTSNDSACFTTCQAHALTKLCTAAVPLHLRQGLKFNTNGFIVVNPTSLHERIVDQHFFPQLTTFPSKVPLRQKALGFSVKGLASKGKPCKPTQASRQTMCSKNMVKVCQNCMNLQLPGWTYKIRYLLSGDSTLWQVTTRRKQTCLLIKPLQSNPAQFFE